MVSWLEDVFGQSGTAYPSATSAVDQANALWQSPMGQAAEEARRETAQFNKDIELRKAKAERDRIKILKGEAAADKWYKEKQIEILRMDHELKARVAEAEATGYWGGNPTLQRENLAAQTALQAGQLGASLRGPRNWAFYLEQAYNTKNSPAASLVGSVPGGLGQNTVTPQRLTLTDVLNDYGVGSGQTGTGQAATAPYSPNGVTAADLGLTDTDEATLKDYFASPAHAPVGWWESKSEDQRNYLRGWAEHTGFSPDTFESIYRSTRPRQGSSSAA